MEETRQTGSFFFLFRQHELLSSIPLNVLHLPNVFKHEYLPRTRLVTESLLIHGLNPTQAGPSLTDDQICPATLTHLRRLWFKLHTWAPQFGELDTCLFPGPPSLPHSSYYTSVLITSCICPPILPLNLPTQGLLLWQALSTTTNLLEVNGLNPQFLTAGSSTKVNNMSLESGTPGLEVSLCLLMK